MQIKQLTAVVTGRVQGVGFRYFIMRAAQKLELCGWVRNRASGEVEVVAQGPMPALQQLLRQVRQGPPSAHVLSVAVQYHDPNPRLHDFELKPTAYV
jgi:acylphosphatase